MLGVPSRWSLLLRVPEPAAVRAGWIYGMLSAWFESHLDDAAHHGPRKPYTISPLRPVAGRPRTVVTVDVGVLLDGLAVQLHEGAARLAAEGGRLGPQPVCGLAWPDGELARLECGAGWGALAEIEPVVGDVELDLESPVVFRRGNGCAPFLTPGLVFGHLRKQWALWGPDLDHPDIDDCAVAVVDHRLSRVHARPRARELSGHVGRVVYRVGSADPSHRAAVARWLAVLPFAGLGAETRMGLGQARLVTAPTDLHRSPGHVRPVLAGDLAPAVDQAGDRTGVRAGDQGAALAAGLEAPGSRRDPGRW